MSYQEDRLLEIANAIRAKGITGQIQASQFAAKIAQIMTGVDTSDATATADVIRTPYTAYAKGAKVTGTLQTYTGTTTVTPSASVQTLATNGMYLGSNITVNPSTGIDTSDATATAAQILAGYVAYAKGQRLIGTSEKPFKYATGSAYTPGPYTLVINAGFFVHSVICIAAQQGAIAVSVGGTGTGYDRRRYVGMNDTNSANAPIILSRNEVSMSLNVTNSYTWEWHAFGY